MKRIAICYDGTWQDRDRTFPTNVAKIERAIKRTTDGTSLPQVPEYRPGIGSGNRWLDRIGGGAFGWGIDEDICLAYELLCLDYEEGDEIYLFGFSRGAYTVRSLAGLMRIAGGLLPKEETAKVKAAYDIYRSKGRYRDARGLSKDELSKRELDRKTKAMAALSPNIRPAKVKLLGCWDTVGSLGVPRTLPLLSRWLNRKYEFHDCQLSNIIEHALHAVAIDENRTVFDYTPMEQSKENIKQGQTLHQVWFPGDHGAVGGGNKVSTALADGALLWMMEQVQNNLKLGLEFDFSRVSDSPEGARPKDLYAIKPQPTKDVGSFAQSSFLFKLGSEPRTIPKDALLHESVYRRWQATDLDYRPTNIPTTLVAQLNQSVSA
ncbi:MAG: DUF2235 domain-containing protein [Nodosilinea sp.]